MKNFLNSFKRRLSYFFLLIKLQIKYIYKSYDCNVSEITSLKINNIIEKYSKNIDFFFIQIGSNDGETGDPIFKYIKKYKWKGILVEPVPYIFEKLKKTYKDFKNLSFENNAIDKENGERIFYRIKKNNNAKNPVWYDQLGSFKKEIVEKHKKEIPDFDENFIEEKVNCISLINLLNKYDVKKIDLLHIDTEGYDYEIIKLIPFENIKPLMILYEHKHLNSSDYDQCKNLLLKHKYNLIEKDSDTFAYL